jgi:hypothetical protein
MTAPVLFDALDAWIRENGRYVPFFRNRRIGVESLILFCAASLKAAQHLVNLRPETSQHRWGGISLHAPG